MDDESDDQSVEYTDNESFNFDLDFRAKRFIVEVKGETKSRRTRSTRPNFSKKSKKKKKLFIYTKYNNKLESNLTYYKYVKNIDYIYKSEVGGDLLYIENRLWYSLFMGSTDIDERVRNRVAEGLSQSVIDDGIKEFSGDSFRIQFMFLGDKSKVNKINTIRKKIWLFLQRNGIEEIEYYEYFLKRNHHGKLIMAEVEGEEVSAEIDQIILILDDRLISFEDYHKIYNDSFNNDRFPSKNKVSDRQKDLNKKSKEHFEVHGVGLKIQKKEIDDDDDDDDDDVEMDSDDDDIVYEEEEEKGTSKCIWYNLKKLLSVIILQHLLLGLLKTKTIIIKVGTDAAAGISDFYGPISLTINWLNSEYNKIVEEKNKVYFIECFVIEIPELKQIYSMEKYLKGKFTKYNNNFGNTMNAFSHFSYHFSNGEHLIVDLQGSKSLLTDPQIHSLDRKYGDGDFGSYGQVKFFSTHKCNDICKSLSLMPFECDRKKKKNEKILLYKKEFKMTKGIGADRDNYLVEQNQNCVLLKCKEEESQTWGSCSVSLDAKEFRNVIVVLCGTIKAKNITKWGGMWIRIDGEKNPNIIFENMADNPVKGDMVLENYEIKMKVPNESCLIHLGLVLIGSGEISVNDMCFTKLFPPFNRFKSGI